jgi:MarR family
LRDTTVGSVFPDDELRRGLQQLVRLSRILEPHSGAGTDASLSEVMALGELVDVAGMSQHELARLLGLEKSTVSRLVQDSSTADGYHESGTQTTDASTDSNSPTTGKPLPDRSGNNYAPSTPNY